MHKLSNVGCLNSPSLIVLVNWQHSANTHLPRVLPHIPNIPIMYYIFIYIDNIPTSYVRCSVRAILSSITYSSCSSIIVDTCLPFLQHHWPLWSFLMMVTWQTGLQKHVLEEWVLQLAIGFATNTIPNCGNLAWRNSMLSDCTGFFHTVFVWTSTCSYLH